MNNFTILLVSVRCIRTSHHHKLLLIFVAYRQHIFMKTGKKLETKAKQVEGIVAISTIFKNSTFKLNYM